MQIGGYNCVQIEMDFYYIIHPALLLVVRAPLGELSGVRSGDETLMVLRALSRAVSVRLRDVVAFGEEWFVGKDGESQVSGVIPEERRLAVPAALSSRWGRGRVQSLHTCLLVLRGSTRGGEGGLKTLRSVHSNGSDLDMNSGWRTEWIEGSHEGCGKAFDIPDSKWCLI
ncbi:hypothetical protein F2Q70_00020618 [Brassica cretica]|uniref:Uncharacterized protein n=1 Tax=Brassica cretica TaxID=69181 RepID=A0A8S9GTW8_BRACR|nr:hypothetical protein F2Q70_00020618 [Brassica cretica]